ncbi:MAG: hypothetical protein HUU06_02280 [Planctomycetaceae bacterium]|nr:hypothetical protein [Planctomycetota bacterium]NUN51600.1 hypothetical protein [Planctomycetaceae bacterium]
MPGIDLPLLGYILLVIEDIVWMLRTTARVARLLLERSELPAIKVGHPWVVRPEPLDTNIKAIEADLILAPFVYSRGTAVSRGAGV